MLYVEKDVDGSYVDEIENLIKYFESFQFCGDDFMLIVKNIDNQIRDVKLVKDDDIYDKLDIYLHHDYNYAFNYDFKNYPLFSFYCNKITICECDTIIKVNDDNIIINLNEFDLKSFDLVE